MQHLIDADEFGLHFNAANSKYGLAPRGMRTRKPGNYDRGSFKLTIILALEAGDPTIAPGLPGSLTKPQVWSRISEEPGTTSAAYCECKSRNAQAANTRQPLLPQVGGSARGSAETRASRGLPPTLPAPGRTRGIRNKSSMLSAGKAMVRGK